MLITVALCVLTLLALVCAKSCNFNIIGPLPSLAASYSANIVNEMVLARSLIVVCLFVLFFQNCKGGSVHHRTGIGIIMHCPFGIDANSVGIQFASGELLKGAVTPTVRIGALTSPPAQPTQSSYGKRAAQRPAQQRVLVDFFISVAVSAELAAWCPPPRLCNPLTDHKMSGSLQQVVGKLHAVADAAPNQHFGSLDHVDTFDAKSNELLVRFTRGIGVARPAAGRVETFVGVDSGVSSIEVFSEDDLIVSATLGATGSSDVVGAVSAVVQSISYVERARNGCGSSRTQ